MDTDRKTCQKCLKNYVIEPEDFIFYEKIQVPPPTFCPRCRAKRRMVFWNHRRLFRKKDALTNKEIFSAFPPHSKVMIFDRNYWISDQWDPMEYGRDYDFSKSFFEQFKELMQSVPFASRAVSELVNSEYCNNANNLKNCYLCFDGNSSENCLYGVGFTGCKDSLDFYSCTEIELSYELFSCFKSYKCFYSQNLKECSNVWFSRDCVSCADCFGCVNLRNKQYCILNVQYTKEEYEQRIKKQTIGSYSSFIFTGKQIRKFWSGQPYRYMNGTRNDDVIGEYGGYPFLQTLFLNLRCAQLMVASISVA